MTNEYFDEIRSYVEDKYPAPAIYVPKCDEILCLRSEIPNPVKMKEITARCRRNMLNWLHDIGILLKLQTRTYYLALHYVDKYLSLTPDLPFKKYKAVCAGAMSLACDIEEIVPPDLNEFSQMTNNAYTTEELGHVKKMIWLKLDFNLVVTLPYDLAVVYCHLIKTIPRAGELEKFNDILFKIMLSNERAGYNGQLSPLAKASSHDLAKACILATYKGQSESLQSLEINVEHRLLAASILKVIPTLTHIKW